MPKNAAIRMTNTVDIIIISLVVPPIKRISDSPITSESIQQKELKNNKAYRPVREKTVFGLLGGVEALMKTV